MKKLTALSAVVALASLLFTGVGMVKADDQPAAPISQVTSDQGSAPEPQPEEQPEAQVQEKQLEQAPAPEENQPAPEESPQSDQQK